MFIDPLGLAELSLSTKDPEKSLFLNIPSEPNICMIVGHGEPGYIGDQDKNRYSIKSLADYIKTTDVCKGATTIKLVMCNSAYVKNGASVAEELLHHLGSRYIVEGATGFVELYYDGTYEGVFEQFTPQCTETCRP